MKPVQQERTLLFFPAQIDIKKKKDNYKIKHYKNNHFQDLLSQLHSAVRKVPLVLFLCSNA